MKRDKKESDHGNVKLLLRLIEENPCIYDFNLPSYSTKTEVEKAWKKISLELNETPQTLKDKWRNLRTVFIRRYRAEMNGKDARNKYYLRDELKFIVPFIRISVPLDQTLPPAANDSDDHHSKTQPANIEFDIEEGDSDEETTFVEVCKPSGNIKRSSYPESSTTVIFENEEPGPSKKTRLSGNSGENKKIFQNLLDSVKDEQQPVFTVYDSTKVVDNNVEAENPRKLFLLSIIPDLNQMDDRQMSKFRRNVLSIIDEILYDD